MTHFILKKSNIHGVGIFADRDFKRGDLVIKWSAPLLLTMEALEILPEKEKHNVSYINGEFMLVPPESRVNHSCNPNVTLRNFCYFAKRKIKKGEEITADYREESWPGFNMKCTCGSKKCEGLVKIAGKAPKGMTFS
jgi:SET domain-containing protein